MESEYFWQLCSEVSTSSTWSHPAGLPVWWSKRHIFNISLSNLPGETEASFLKEKKQGLWIESAESCWTLFVFWVIFRVYIWSAMERRQKRLWANRFWECVLFIAKALTQLDKISNKTLRATQKKDLDFLLPLPQKVRLYGWAKPKAMMCETYKKQSTVDKKGDCRLAPPIVYTQLFSMSGLF